MQNYQQPKSAFWSLFIPLWNLLLCLLKVFVWIFSCFKSELKERTYTKDRLNQLKALRASYDKCIVFFCSSAGEYEQAIPLIEKIKKEKPHFFIHIFLFSKSAIIFARKREHNFSFSLAPFDFSSEWKNLFTVLKPSLFYVVRHEFWPNFLVEGSSFGPIYLINASKRASKNAHHFIKKFFKKKFFLFFEKIFVVSEDDKKFFISIYHLEDKKLVVCGDTKYDRALSYAEKIQKENPQVCLIVKKFFDKKNIFIIGSAWDEDIELCLKGYSLLDEKLKNQIAIVIAPHQISEKRKNFIGLACDSHRLKCQFYTSFVPSFKQTDVLVLDTIGHLSALYSIALWAWVGGGIHHQVHNVLEPASFALSIRFGKNFYNSAEAVDLVKSSLAAPLEKSEELAEWLKNDLIARENGRQIYEHIQPHSGATIKIFSTLASL